MFFFLVVDENDGSVVGDNKFLFGNKVFLLINVFSVLLKWFVVLVDGIYVI